MNKLCDTSILGFKLSSFLKEFAYKKKICSFL